ncbi:MAG: isoprenylcysteine carboxylmethyltransferase family protein [Candidatus Jordarchaeaceae archaeon]
MSETQTRRLVVDGAYKYTRNPMMFGYLLILVGLGFLFNSLFLTFGATSIFTVGLVTVIKLWEEKNLERRFGEAYVEYKKKVSFLIPMPPKKQK